MPFYNNVYYPWPEPQGSQSSASAPSLLSSPLSQRATSGQGGAAMSTPSSSAAAIPPFAFRARRESVDWRRVAAVDVELVASELDFHTLQEHVQAVAFCNVEGERCGRCQGPVDPALLKLFRLAQLTVEYLLHTQEYLAASVGASEERLAAAARDRDQLLAREQRQAEEVKALSAELKQRKKMMKSQQNMLAARLSSCHKCQHCDKAFMNSSFLQNHMQRRHPEAYDMQLRSEQARKAEVDSLREVRAQMEQLSQRQQELQIKAAQEKEQKSLYEDQLRKEVQRWKEVEFEQINRKLEDTTGGLRREMDLILRNNAQLSQQSQVARQEPAASPAPRPAPRQAERDTDRDREAVHRLEHKLQKQDEKWESRLQSIKAEHESEKNQLHRELARLQASMSEQQERSRALRREMDQRLQEKELTIQAQRQEMKHIASNTAIKTVEVPVIVTAPVPESKPKRVACDPSSASEEQPEVERPEQKQEARKRPVGSAASVLRKNPSIKRELRPALEQALAEKLEALGIRPGLSGLKTREYSELLTKLRSERERVARDVPDYWRHRQNLGHRLELALEGMRTGKDSAQGHQDKPGKPSQVSQNRPRSSSLPSRVTQVTSGPSANQAKTPQPVPRARTSTQPAPKTRTNTQPAPRTRTSTQPKTSTPRTPPFSSDEESEEDETEEEEEMEEQPHKHRHQHQAPQPRSPQSEPAPARAKPAPAKPAHAHANLAQRIQPLSPAARRPAGPAVSTSAPAVCTAKTASTVVESDGEWTEGSEMEEIHLDQLHHSKDHNGNVEKTANNNQIKDLTKSLMKQLADRAPKIPVGGVSTSPQSKDLVRDLKYPGMDESSEDWDVSSLEELAITGPSQPVAPGSAPAPVRKSLDSSGTSVWSTATGKAQKSGNGSTLKSSLVSISDFSDSDDI